jgi:hypothetical protein
MKTNLNLSLTGISPMTLRAGHSTVRRGSNLTTATRESSAQPTHRPNGRVNLRQPGLLPPPTSAATLPQPAPFHTRHQTPARRFRVRAGAVDRDYLRAARAAEMAAWHAASPSDPGRLHAERKSRTEEFVFSSILTLALAGVIWGLADSAPLQTFVSFVRQLIG